MVCWIESTTNPKLQEYIEKYGQKDGLTQFIREIAGTNIVDDFAIGVPAPESTWQTKLVQHLNKQLRHKQSRIEKLSKEDKLKRAKLSEEISDLKEKIAQAEVSQELTVVETLAKSQMDWINSMLNKPNLTSAEINEISVAIDLWSNIRDIIFDKEDNVNPTHLQKVTDIENRVNSNDFTNRWWNVLGNYLTTLTKYDNPSQLFKEFYKLEDVSAGRGWTLSLADAGIELIGETDKIIRNAFNRSQLEVREIKRKINSAFAPLKEKGKLEEFTHLTVQLDSKGQPTKGLVGEYSQFYWDNIRDVSRKARAAASKYFADKSPANKKAFSNAMKEKRKWLNNNTIHVDVRFIKDPNFVTESGKSWNTHKQELIDILGEKKANEVIEQAKERYEEFKDFRENIQISFEDSIETGEITVPEGVSKEQHLSNLMREWDLKNNPELWFAQGDITYKGEYTQNHNKWTYTIPRRIGVDGKDTGFYDKNYQKIMSDSDMANAFNVFKESMDNLLSYIPAHLKQDIQSNFLPQFKKELVREYSLMDAAGALTAIATEFRDSLLSRRGLNHNEIDPDTGQPYKQVPMIGLTPVETLEMSTDLKNIIGLFADSAIHYKYKAEALDTVNLVHNFLDKIVEDPNRKNYTKDELVNLRNMMDYTKEALFYGNYKIEEGVMKKWRVFGGKAIHIKNLEKSEEIDKKLQRLRKKHAPLDAFEMIVKEFPNDVEIISEKQRWKQIENEKTDLEEQLFLNKITQEEFDSKVELLEKEANGLGKSVVASRIGDAAMKYIQASAFWFNPFSAFNNYMFGITSTAMWATAGKEFDLKDFRRSFGLIGKSMLNLKDKKLDKVANLVALFDVLHESKDFQTEQGNATLNKLKNVPYILLTKGDYFIKGQTLIAMLLGKKITTKNGNEISLFEAFDDAGNWRSELFSDEVNNSWDVSRVSEQGVTEFLNFKNHADAIVKKLHGNFDPKSPARYKNFVLGRMLGQFRFSWMSVGIEQRFGKKQFDPYLGREVEGRYRTYANLGAMKSVKTLFKLALRQYDSAFEGIRAQDRAVVEENMRKNLMEVYIYSVLFGIMLTLKAMSKGGDDDDYKYRLAYNMLWRVMGETTFYLSPKTFLEITRDPLPVMQIAKRASSAYTGALDLLLEDELTDSEKERSIAKLTNTVPALNNFNKFMYATQRLR